MHARAQNQNVKHLAESPHGEIEEILENIFFVRGGIRMPMLMPMKFGRSMTILRHSDGNLTLVNSMRLSEKGLASLESLGRVANVLRIGGFHGRDDAFYRERFGAKVFAVEGHRYIRGMSDKSGGSVEYMKADTYLNENSALPWEGASLKVINSSSPKEGIILLKRDGGILITGDSLQHTPKADEFTNFPAKMMMGKMGFYKDYNVGPGWLQFGKPKAEDVRSVMELDFENVFPGHGMAVIGGAKQKFRPALEGELKGCHED